MEIYVNYLAIEVTRRCNMKCNHCLRGDAQNLDISTAVLSGIAKHIHPASVIFTGGEPSLKILRGLSFLGRGKKHSVEDDDLSWLLNTGRANKNGIGVRAPEVLRTDMDELVTDYSTEYNSIAFDTLYIAANGNVVDGCDSSYEDIDDEENVICKVNQLQKKVKDYVKNADSQIS